MRNAWLPVTLAALILAAIAFWRWGEPRVSSESGVPRSAGQAALVDQAGAPGRPLAAAMPLPEGLLPGQTHRDVRDRIRSRLVGNQPLFADDRAFEEARQQLVLFSTGLDPDAAARSPLANERRLHDGRHWIRYDMRVLAARAEGDRFILPLPGYSAAEAEIDLVETGTGAFHWSGRLLGILGGTFRITQDFTDKYAVGSIQTPQGEYLLEVKAGSGWVTDSGKEFVLPPDGNDTIMAPGEPPHRH